MRKINLLLVNAAVVATVLLSSCKKDEEVTPDSTSSDVVSSASLTTYAGYKVYNASGTSNGAFDFDAMASVLTADAAGDFQDQGVPVVADVVVEEVVVKEQLFQAERINIQSSDNWKKQFVVENGATLKEITKAQYEGVKTEADIKTIGEDVTGVVSYAVDNAYVIKTSAGKYVAFVITAVTEASGNNDYVMFSTKSVVEPVTETETVVETETKTEVLEQIVR